MNPRSRLNVQDSTIDRLPPNLTTHDPCQLDSALGRAELARCKSDPPFLFSIVVPAGSLKFMCNHNFDLYITNTCFSFPNPPCQISFLNLQIQGRISKSLDFKKPKSVKRRLSLSLFHKLFSPFHQMSYKSLSFHQFRFFLSLSLF